MRNEGVNFDYTENIFIEGDNLDALKVLQKAYYGKVKMIYIDPPYNTGNDFVYNDKFAEKRADYEQEAGLRDENGMVTRADGLRKNSRDNGHYHSNWLNMMYPRLYLARNLLRSDGVIFASIDDNEVHNLRQIMGDIFGEENFIATLVWEKGRKNDAKLFSVGHEYMIVFAKSLQVLKDQGIVWRESKPGASDIWEKYLELKAKNGDNFEQIENELAAWYKTLATKDPAKKLSRYKHVDKDGPWRDRDISWPGGGGPKYEVIHPVTNEPCVVPEAGWRFASLETMQQQIDLGLVVFREDHTKPPFRKAHLYPISSELLDDEEETEDEDQSVGLQVMPSVIYKQSQVAVKYLRRLMGGKIFDNPKDVEVLSRLVQYATSKDDLILDFFAGSGTTAEAVMQANTDGGNRKWICIQLPEETNEKSEAFKAGYRNIAELSRERIRRAAKEIANQEEVQSDTGFKTMKLEETNFKIWDSSARGAQLKQQMIDHLNPVKDGVSEEDLLLELALKSGISPTASRKQFDNTDGKYHVIDDSLAVCLEPSISASLFENILSTKPNKVIILDSSLHNNDELKTNLLLRAQKANIEILVV
jgi:adenine-specific DNA-methyltransferase